MITLYSNFAQPELKCVLEVDHHCFPRSTPDSSSQHTLCSCWIWYYDHMCKSTIGSLIRPPPKEAFPCSLACLPLPQPCGLARIETYIEVKSKFIFIFILMCTFFFTVTTTGFLKNC